MSPEVYVFVFIIGLLMFVPTVFIVSRYVEKPLRRFVISSAITLFLSPIIYVCLIVLWVWSSTWYPNRNFSHEEWVASEDRRYEMTKDIVKSKILVGKTKSEVLELLGKENNREESDQWSYSIGFEPELLNIDPSFIVIYFEDGKVILVEQHHS